MVRDEQYCPQDVDINAFQSFPSGFEETNDNDVGSKGQSIVIDWSIYHDRLNEREKYV